MVTFRYFAYGSNLWLPRMRERCPSARFVLVATLPGWVAVYDKPGADGSAKLNIRPNEDATVAGVVYEIDAAERALLDAAEPSYTPIETALGLTYAYAGPAATSPPADWYVAIVEAGARFHGLPLPARPPGSST
jgi:cation transport regulator ChaC